MVIFLYIISTLLLGYSCLANTGFVLDPKCQGTCTDEVWSDSNLQIWDRLMLSMLDKFFTFFFSRKRFCITKTRLFKYIETFTSKNWTFSDTKDSDIFHISAQNIDCGYSLELPQQGGSNEYPQSMFLSRNKKNNVYPCKPQFYYIKVGFKGVKII